MLISSFYVSYLSEEATFKECLDRQVLQFASWVSFLRQNRKVVKRLLKIFLFWRIFNWIVASYLSSAAALPNLENAFVKEVSRKSLN